jgi:hypothetical protein
MTLAARLSIEHRTKPVMDELDIFKAFLIPRPILIESIALIVERGGCTLPATGWRILRIRAPCRPH